MEENQTTTLQKIIVDRIEARGPLTFADYMAACLYEPGLGYYTSPGRKVGAEGDFYTSSNVHEVFGRLIGREISRMWEVMGHPAGFQIVEVGAGNGRLACDIVGAIAELAPTLYAGLTYRFIEAEPSLADAQRLMLGEHAAKGAWSTPADLAAGNLAITGCILSNELIDALPTHLVQMTADGLREVYVTVRDGELAEVLEVLSTPDIQAYLDRIGVRLVEGQRAEINLAAGDWLAGVARSLTRGFVLTIDYGYPAVELYSPHHLNGTLLCYYRHTTEENPYIRSGEQDITSHVDFTSLALCGAELGLQEVWFGEQYRFLLGAGMMEELLALEARATTEPERIKHRLALKKLLLPDGGMGDTFRVLIQARGVENPRLLCMREWGKSF
ncbi:MAG: SAM-dependent methyltransferase [Geobacter sp.]|nr:MAG: SAM-dependent methyltransferase [Geobacter sp.]